MKHKIRDWLQDDFLRHTGIMVVGTGLVNLFNLIYQLALVRILSVVDYGVLNALVSIMYVFSQFSATLRPALTKFLAVHLSRNEFEQARFLLRRAAAHLGLISALILIVFFLGGGPLAAFLRIEGRLYIVLVGVLVAASTMAVIPGVSLWGSQRFKYLACLNVSSTFFKLVIGVGLVSAGLGVAGALIGYNAYPVFVLIIGIFLIRGFWRGDGENEVSGSRVFMLPVYKYCIPTGAALLSLAVLTSIDVVLVKHFFSPRDAGFYSVAQMVGKIILFLPGAVSIVVFPKAAAARARKEESFHLLKKGLVIIAAFDAVAVVICAVAPGLILKILTGKTDPESIRLVVWFAIAMSFYAMTWLNIFYNLSIHKTRFVKYLAIFALAQACTIYMYHPGLVSVIGIVNIFAFLSFVVTLYLSKAAPGVGGREPDIQ